MCGLPEVHERLKRSDRGERSRTRNGTMRKMLRGESWTVRLGGDGGVLVGDTERDEAAMVGDRVFTVWTGEDWMVAVVVRGTCAPRGAVVPRGVSSSFTLEEDAEYAFDADGGCACGGDCAGFLGPRSLRCCEGRRVNWGTLRY